MSLFSLIKAYRVFSSGVKFSGELLVRFLRFGNDSGSRFIPVNCTSQLSVVSYFQYANSDICAYLIIFSFSDKVSVSF
ncbi:hypothetical protein HOG21_02270 [bacterium]|nr:hypothetical protein [bacterium]